MPPGGCGMDFKRLALMTRKIVEDNKRISSEQMSIFVKLPFNNKSTITLTVQPLDQVAAIKQQIEARTQCLVSWQSLLLGSGRRLDDRKTLAAYNICKDSTLHLKLTPGKRLDDCKTIAIDASSRISYVPTLDPKLTAEMTRKAEMTPCEIGIKVMPIHRFVSVNVEDGLRTTVRELKDFIFREEGIVCDGFYLDEDVTKTQLVDNLPLANCCVPERTLVAVQSEIDFEARGGGTPLNSHSEGKRGLLAVRFNAALDTNRTVPSLGVTEPLEVRRHPTQQNSQQGGVSDIETATTAHTHRDCERRLTLMLEEKNRLQTDLLDLQTIYPKLLSDMLDERNRLEQDLKDLRSEFPRQLSLVLEGKNKLQQQLVEVQGEFDRQVSFVLDENSTIEKELATLKVEFGLEKEKSLCTICFEKPRDTLVFSCLHLHFCSSCLQKHQERTNTCPICRGFISGKLVCNVAAF